MKMKKIISCLLACSMMAASATALAASPFAYDGNSYDSMGYTSTDPDGQFDLAVIANNDVKIVGDAMYIKGSVYSNGDIYVSDGGRNKIDGLFISNTEGSVDESMDGNNKVWNCDGYIHVNNDGTRDGITYYSTRPEYYGAIKDENTSFECEYTDFEIPEIANNIGSVEMNVYGDDGSWGGAITTPQTLTEDTRIEELKIEGTQSNWRDYPAGLIIDTTNGPVTVVIDKLVSIANPSIKVVGDNRADIYIGQMNNLSDLTVNYSTKSWPGEISGSVDNTHLYITGENVSFKSSKIAVADMKVNAKSLEISGSTVFYGNIDSNANSFVITGGGTEVYGTVCVPTADSQVVGSGILYGQLHTDFLTMNGAGSIVYNADAGNVTQNEATPTPEPTHEPAPEPVPTETPEVTAAPEVPTGDEIDLYGLGYAYIFGYEPNITTEETVNDQGEVVRTHKAEVRMAPQDDVTREQVGAMIMRMVDQKYGTTSQTYPITDAISKHKGTWYVRGLAYLAQQGAFDDVDSVECGAVTRGEVAKLLTFGLNLSKIAENTYTDVAQSPYKTYVDIVSAYGYMNGVDENLFEPDRVMTRAEFCQMLNNVIGRTDMGLIAQDGSTVTPEVYSIVDLDGHWAEDAMLKATSAYDQDGLIDVETRIANIRNILDNYDSQKWY